MSTSNLSRLLARWRKDPTVMDSVIHWETSPAREALTAPFPADLHPLLADALRRLGITSLYSHQLQAWQHVRAGENVVVATGTASGKTLCYNLPVADRILREPNARALYIYPTKALAQDQLSALRALSDALDTSSSPPAHLPASVYDGDTATSSRASIRTQARILATNPDMLHTGILPHHTLWADFFRRLRFVVIDEVHVYRGVFGSHLANVLRRMQRVARFYGSAPQFILTSATIANPVELSERLIEAPVALVDADGSAHGARHFLIYNPPLVDRDLGLRRSALIEGVRLSSDLIASGVQTILFGRSRHTVEILLSYLRQELPDQSAAIRGYRSGYLPHERRAIERGLRDGSVRAVAATNALELGIDIGGMGAAVLVGYPGTIAATRQQAGRAGRKSEDALAVLVTSADALDQFLAHHPEYLLGRPVEQALIDPDNLLILLAHVRCAAFELPFRQGEGFGRVPAETVAEFLTLLEQAGAVHASQGRYFWTADQYPAASISLRSASANAVVLQVQTGENSQTVGEVDFASALWMVHPQAVYLHEGQSYLVENLDLQAHVARLKPFEGDYYTEPRRETTVQKIAEIEREAARGFSKSYGEVLVTTQVTGFRKVRWFTHENLGYGQVDLPPTELRTTAYWLTLSEETVDGLRALGLWSSDRNNYGPNWDQMRNLARARDNYRCQICQRPEEGRAHPVHHKVPFRTFPSYVEANRLDNLITLCPECHRRVEMNVRVRSGLAGMAYALGHLAPLFVMCDDRDLGVHSDPQSPLGDGGPTIAIYDTIPAGIGLSRRLFEIHDELIERAYELVAACECQDGCPSCVGPVAESGEGGKREALALLALLANRDIPVWIESQ